MRPIVPTFGTLLLLLNISLPLHADTNPSELVEKLASPQFAERQSALKALELLGAKAIPALEDGVQHQDLEIQRRSQTILRRILIREASEPYLKPRRVQLQWENASSDQVARTLQTTFGLDSRPRLDLPKPVTFDSGKLPLWQALDHVSRHVQKSIVPIPGKKDYFQDSSPLTAYSRWYFSVAGDAQAWSDRNSSILYQARTSSDPEKLDFIMAVDPMLSGLPAIQDIRWTKWLDNSGKELPISEPFLPSEPFENLDSGSLTTPQNRSPVAFYQTSVSFKKAFNPREMHGIATGRLMIKKTIVQISQLFRSEGKTFSGIRNVSLKVEEIEPVEDDSFRIHVKVKNGSQLVRLPSNPEVVRLKPGVIAIRGVGDYVGDLVQFSDARGGNLPRTLVEQPKNDGDWLALKFHVHLGLEKRENAKLEIVIQNQEIAEFSFRLSKDPLFQ